jgi:hypothetical protein
VEVSRERSVRWDTTVSEKSKKVEKGVGKLFKNINKEFFNLKNIFNTKCNQIIILSF